MLDFSVAAHGWDVVYTALLTGGSVVLAYFLGRASERNRDRWQQFDGWAARVTKVTQGYADAAAARQPADILTRGAYERLVEDGRQALARKDRVLWSHIVGLLSDSAMELQGLPAKTDGKPGSYTPESIDRLWGAAGAKAVRPRLELIGYRESAKKRRELVSKIRSEWG